MASETLCPAAPPTSLAEVQALLFHLVTAPSGVGPGLKERGLPSDALDALIVGDARLSATARLDIYANMYFFRILDVLREEYPRVAAALGAEAFHDLITDFLLAKRPAHPSLREVGAPLAAYLATHPRGLERPWLAALADLERAHREVFDGPDALPLAFERVRDLAPEAFVALPVRLIPAHRILAHGFELGPSWERLSAAATAERPEPGAPAPAAGRETLLVWRRQLVVHHRAIGDPAELSMLRDAATGTTLGALCQGFVAARSSEVGDGPTRLDESDDVALGVAAFQLLARWLDDGLLT